MFAAGAGASKSPPIGRRGILSDFDIWRAAQAMVKRYSDSAATEAAMRADEFLDQGNLDGKRLWMRIMQTIEELQRERPREGEAVH